MASEDLFFDALVDGTEVVRGTRKAVEAFFLDFARTALESDEVALAHLVLELNNSRKQLFGYAADLADLHDVLGDHARLSDVAVVVGDALAASGEALKCLAKCYSANGK